MSRPATSTESGIRAARQLSPQGQARSVTPAARDTAGPARDPLASRLPRPFRATNRQVGASEPDLPSRPHAASSLLSEALRTRPARSSGRPFPLRASPPSRSDQPVPAEQSPWPAIALLQQVSCSPPRQRDPRSHSRQPSAAAPTREDCSILFIPPKGLPRKYETTTMSAAGSHGLLDVAVD